MPRLATVGGYEPSSGASLEKSESLEISRKLLRVTYIPELVQLVTFGQGIGQLGTDIASTVVRRCVQALE